MSTKFPLKAKNHKRYRSLGEFICVEISPPDYEQLAADRKKLKDLQKVIIREMQEAPFGEISTGHLMKQLQGLL